jgi:hypothetical protein
LAAGIATCGKLSSSLPVGLAEAGLLVDVPPDINEENKLDIIIFFWRKMFGVPRIVQIKIQKKRFLEMKLSPHCTVSNTNTGYAHTVLNT